MEKTNSVVVTGSRLLLDGLELKKIRKYEIKNSAEDCGLAELIIHMDVIISEVENG